MTAANFLLQDLLTRSASRFPEKVAFVAGNERFTYAGILLQANALAHALRRRGVARGDRVIILAENSPLLAIAFFGALAADAVPSVLHPSTRPERLAWLLRDCRASALIAHGHLARTWLPALAGAQFLKCVISEQLPAVDERPPGLPELSRWSDALAAELASAPPRRNIDVDLASLIYTSGSTGDPKGVMLTHRNMLAATESIASYLSLAGDDVIASALPMSFDYGLYQMLLAFSVGARLVVDRSFAFPPQFLKTMVDERATGFPGVPTMFATLAEMATLDSYDLSSLRFVTNTAAALPVRHIRMLRELFPRARIYSMYGLTECKRCTYLPPEDLDRKPESVGIAIPNTELWLVDEAGRRLGPGQVGQLVIRGATVMRGYWERPDETAARLKPGPLPGEQVLYTGDLCRLDEEGDLTFVARMDDVIKTRGEKVAPKEVESALAAVAGVKEAAVIGVPDALAGQAIKAFVVPQEGAELREGALLAECKKRLEPWKVPRQIAIVPGLPHSANGKIHKGELR